MLIRIIAKHSDCVPAIAPQKEPVRDLCVKVHVRRSGKDAWTYLGRAFVSQELVGHSAQTSRVGEWCGLMTPATNAHVVPVLRSAASNKILTSFSEVSSHISCLMHASTYHLSMHNRTRTYRPKNEATS